MALININNTEYAIRFRTAVGGSQLQSFKNTTEGHLLLNETEVKLLALKAESDAKILEYTEKSAAWQAAIEDMSALKTIYNIN